MNLLIELNETEKRILSLLTMEDPLSKRQIAEKTQLSWSTVVKFVTQLEHKNILKVEGTLNRELNIGKNAYTYTFNDKYPLAIGVDVEYKTTHIILTNLKMEVLKEECYKTVPLVDSYSLEKFLKESIDAFLSDFQEYGAIIAMGIGLPGIGAPIFSIPDDGGRNKDLLSKNLQEYFGLPNEIRMNIKAYTLYQNLYGTGVRNNNFIAVTIRTGVGCGVVLGGQLYTGQYGVAGMIGHVTVDPDGLDCLCGRRGCLETIISQQALKRQFASSMNTYPESVTLEELFSKADSGNEPARTIVLQAASSLGEAIGHALLSFNISRVIVSTYFGNHSDLFAKQLEDTIRRNILLNQELDVEALDLDPRAYSLGAALLVFNSLFSETWKPTVHG